MSTIGSIPNRGTLPKSLRTVWQASSPLDTNFNGVDNDKYVIFKFEYVP